MQEPAKPSNEAERIATLTQLDIINGQSEERFDRITRVLAALFNVPVAMVNMITPEEQINKSCFGMDAGFHMDRGISFCGHTILSDEPLIIENALEDERFKDNPVVVGEMHVRAYAGIPLKALDGTHPGALCLIDSKPRSFSKKDIALLTDLAAWAEIELNSSQLREALTEISRAHREAEVRLAETNRLNELMIGRELKMTEMKKEISDLKEKLAQAS